MTENSDTPNHSTDSVKPAGSTESEPQVIGSDSPASEGENKVQAMWPQLRQLLVFQVKLYVDALRDLLMSPLSIILFIADQVQGNKGDETLFESLLQFGRKTEKAINLFNQHDATAEDIRGIDSLITQVEEGLRREYSDGSVSGSTRDTLEKALSKLRERLGQVAGTAENRDRDS